MLRALRKYGGRRVAGAEGVPVVQWMEAQHRSSFGA